jgi:hypothetical protein
MPVTSKCPQAPPRGRREEPDQVDVRIGIIQTPKELEVELKDDADRDKVVATSRSCSRRATASCG